MKFLKCSRCGCEGIHACMGDVSSQNTKHINISKYSRIEDAIKHIQQSEKKRKK